MPDVSLKEKILCRGNAEQPLVTIIARQFPFMLLVATPV
jgi:hypothetical protein